MNTLIKFLSGVFLSALLVPLGVVHATDVDDVADNQRGTDVTEQVGETSDDQQIEEPAKVEQMDETANVENVDELASAVDLADGLVVNIDEALEIFGSSDRNGTGSPNAYTIASDENGRAWAPVFKDEAAFKDSLSSISKRGEVRRLQVSEQADANPLTIRVSKYSRAEVENAIEELGNMFEGKDVTFSFNYDPSLDAIDVGCEAASCSVIPDEVAGVTVVKETSAIEMLAVGDKARFYTDTKAPYRGGSAVWGRDRVSGKYGPYCTMGIPAKNSAGTPGIFTAGHCFQAGSHVFTSATLAGGYNAGKVTHSFSFPSVDAQFISGKTYTNQIFASNGSKPVEGVYFPSAGQGKRLCFTGATSGINCQNSVLRYNYVYMYKGLKITNLIVLGNGHPGQPGDSGGPVYANFGNTVKVSGMITGGENKGGKIQTLVTDWRAVERTYNAKLR